MRKDEVHQVLTLGATGRLSRREVNARLAVLGLGASAIASAMAGAGLQPARAATTGRRGDNCVLKLLYWQAPTILNPYLAAGVKDFDASRVCLEPLFDCQYGRSVYAGPGGRGALARQRRAVRRREVRHVQSHRGVGRSPRAVPSTVD